MNRPQLSAMTLPLQLQHTSYRVGPKFNKILQRVPIISFSLLLLKKFSFNISLSTRVPGLPGG